MANQSARMRPAGRNSGFTLIELMITVAIVAILAAVAYPSYASHLRKGRRAEAQAYLMDIAQRQQQYFTDNRAYAVDNGTVTAANTLSAVAPGDLSGFYAITTQARAGVSPSFLVTATPVPGSAQVPDGSLTLDETGAKTPSDKW